MTDKVAFTELLLTLAPRAVNTKVKALLVAFAFTILTIPRILAIAYSGRRYHIYHRRPL